MRATGCPLTGGNDQPLPRRTRQAEVRATPASRISPARGVSAQGPQSPGALTTPQRFAASQSRNDPRAQSATEASAHPGLPRTNRPRAGEPIHARGTSVAGRRENDTTRPLGRVVSHGSGAGEGTRTLGLLITSELLCRLSYSGAAASVPVAASASRTGIRSSPTRRAGRWRKRRSTSSVSLGLNSAIGLAGVAAGVERGRGSAGVSARTSWSRLSRSSADPASASR